LICLQGKNFFYFMCCFFHLLFIFF